jgi:hypothetical protein
MPTSIRPPLDGRPRPPMYAKVRGQEAWKKPLALAITGQHLSFAGLRGWASFAGELLIALKRPCVFFFVLHKDFEILAYQSSTACTL